MHAKFPPTPLADSSCPSGFTQTTTGLTTSQGHTTKHTCTPTPGDTDEQSNPGAQSYGKGSDHKHEHLCDHCGNPGHSVDRSRALQALGQLSASQQLALPAPAVVTTVTPTAQADAQGVAWQPGSALHDTTTSGSQPQQDRPDGSVRPYPVRAQANGGNEVRHFICKECGLANIIRPPPEWLDYPIPLAHADIDRRRQQHGTGELPPVQAKQPQITQQQRVVVAAPVVASDPGVPCIGYSGYRVFMAARVERQPDSRAVLQRADGRPQDLLNADEESLLFSCKTCASTCDALLYAQHLPMHPWWPACGLVHSTTPQLPSQWMKQSNWERPSSEPCPAPARQSLALDTRPRVTAPAQPTPHRVSLSRKADPPCDAALDRRHALPVPTQQLEQAALPTTLAATSLPLWYSLLPSTESASFHGQPSQQPGTSRPDGHAAATAPEHSPEQPPEHLPEFWRRAPLSATAETSDAAARGHPDEDAQQGGQPSYPFTPSSCNNGDPQLASDTGTYVVERGVQHTAGGALHTAHPAPDTPAEAADLSAALPEQLTTGSRAEEPVEVTLLRTSLAQLPVSATKPTDFPSIGHQFMFALPTHPRLPAPPAMSFPHQETRSVCCTDDGHVHLSASVLKAAGIWDESWNSSDGTSFLRHILRLDARHARGQECMRTPETHKTTHLEDTGLHPYTNAIAEMPALREQVQQLSYLLEHTKQQRPQSLAAAKKVAADCDASAQMLQRFTSGREASQKSCDQGSNQLLEAAATAQQTARVAQESSRPATSDAPAPRTGLHLAAAQQPQAMLEMQEFGDNTHHDIAPMGDPCRDVWPASIAARAARTGRPAQANQLGQASPAVRFNASANHAEVTTPADAAAAPVEEHAPAAQQPENTHVGPAKPATPNTPEPSLQSSRRSLPPLHDSLAFPQFFKQLRFVKFPRHTRWLKHSISSCLVRHQHGVCTLVITSAVTCLLVAASQAMGYSRPNLAISLLNGVTVAALALFAALCAVLRPKPHLVATIQLVATTQPQPPNEGVPQVTHRGGTTLNPQPTGCSFPRPRDGQLGAYVTRQMMSIDEAAAMACELFPAGAARILARYIESVEPLSWEVRLDNSMSAAAIDGRLSQMRASNSHMLLDSLRIKHVITTEQRSIIDQFNPATFKDSNEAARMTDRYVAAIRELNRRSAEFHRPGTHYQERLRLLAGCPEYELAHAMTSYCFVQYVEIQRSIYYNWAHYRASLGLPSPADSPLNVSLGRMPSGAPTASPAPSPQPSQSLSSSTHSLVPDQAPFQQETPESQIADPGPDAASRRGSARPFQVLSRADSASSPCSPHDGAHSLAADVIDTPASSSTGGPNASCAEESAASSPQIDSNDRARASSEPVSTNSPIGAAYIDADTQEVILRNKDRHRCTVVSHAQEPLAAIQAEAASAMLGTRGQLDRQSVQGVSSAPPANADSLSSNPIPTQPQGTPASQEPAPAPLEPPPPTTAGRQPPGDPLVFGPAPPFQQSAPESRMDATAGGGSARQCYFSLGSDSAAAPGSPHDRAHSLAEGVPDAPASSSTGGPNTGHAEDSAIAVDHAYTPKYPCPYGLDPVAFDDLVDWLRDRLQPPFPALGSDSSIQVPGPQGGESGDSTPNFSSFRIDNSACVSVPSEPGRMNSPTVLMPSGQCPSSAQSADAANPSSNPAQTQPQPAVPQESSTAEPQNFSGNHNPDPAPSPDPDHDPDSNPSPHQTGQPTVAYQPPHRRAQSPGGSNPALLLLKLRSHLSHQAPATKLHEARPHPEYPDTVPDPPSPHSAAVMSARLEHEQHSRRFARLKPRPPQSAQPSEKLDGPPPRKSSLSSFGRQADHHEAPDAPTNNHEPTHHVTVGVLKVHRKYNPAKPSPSNDAQQTGQQSLPSKANHQRSRTYCGSSSRDRNHTSANNKWPVPVNPKLKPSYTPETAERVKDGKYVMTPEERQAFHKRDQTKKATVASLKQGDFATAMRLFSANYEHVVTPASVLADSGASLGLCISSRIAEKLGLTWTTGSAPLVGVGGTSHSESRANEAVVIRLGGDGREQDVDTTPEGGCFTVQIHPYVMSEETATSLGHDCIMGQPLLWRSLASFNQLSETMEISPAYVSSGCIDFRISIPCNMTVDRSPALVTLIMGKEDQPLVSGFLPPPTGNAVKSAAPNINTTSKAHPRNPNRKPGKGFAGMVLRAVRAAPNAVLGLLPDASTHRPRSSPARPAAPERALPSSGQGSSVRRLEPKLCLPMGLRRLQPSPSALHAPTPEQEPSGHSSRPGALAPGTAPSAAALQSGKLAPLSKRPTGGADTKGKAKAKPPPVKIPVVPPRYITHHSQPLSIGSSPAEAARAHAEAAQNHQGTRTCEPESEPHRPAGSNSNANSKPAAASNPCTASTAPAHPVSAEQQGGQAAPTPRASALGPRAARRQHSASKLPPGTEASQAGSPKTQHQASWRSHENSPAQIPDAVAKALTGLPQPKTRRQRRR
jgi:hypothetical protein